MNPSYTVALQESWSRMVRMLFRPFQLERWLTVGFAAFLANYFSHPGGPRGGGGWRSHGWHGETPEALRHAAGFLLHPAWGPLIAALALLAMVAVLLFAWASARGKLIFLENVLTERAAFFEPWRRFKRLGNSLFIFWLIFTVLAVAVGLGISLPVLIPILQALESGESWGVLISLIAVWWVIVMAPFLLVVSLTYLFLEQFVVPIMHRQNVGVLEGWRRFFTLFSAHAAHFIGFALLYLLLSVAAGIGIVIVGFATCCVGFLLLGIPYVSSVILLPLEVTLRGLGPDFLAQLGPEWAIAPAAGAPPVSTPPASGSAPPPSAPQ